MTKNFIEINTVNLATFFTNDSNLNNLFNNFFEENHDKILNIIYKTCKYLSFDISSYNIEDDDLIELYKEVSKKVLLDFALYDILNNFSQSNISDVITDLIKSDCLISDGCHISAILITSLL